MNVTSIFTQVESLKTRPNGSATGRIWLEFGGHAFPSSRWDDFVVVVLGWWVEAILRVIQKNDSVVVNFMDGPYSVEIYRDAFNTLFFNALNSSNFNGGPYVGSADLNSFAADLIFQSQKILTACRQQNWWSNDAEMLNINLELLAKNVFRN